MNVLTKSFTSFLGKNYSLGIVVWRRKVSSDYRNFAQVLKEAKNIVVITGEGISTESGLPASRDYGDTWEYFKVYQLTTPTAFQSNPSLIWEFYQFRRDEAFKCKPNNAHLALVQFEKMCKEQGKDFCVMTHSVDGLHKRAGTQNLFELNGSINHVRCTHCNHVEENLEDPICDALGERSDQPGFYNIDVEFLPRCKKCNALVRPHVVWYGEDLDKNVVDHCEKMAQTCELCLVIGTSSFIYPTTRFVPMVANRGKPVAEFNDVFSDKNFQFHFGGPCGTTLPKALGVLPSQM